MKDLYTRPELITMAREHGLTVNRLRIDGADNMQYIMLWEIINPKTGEQYITSTKLGIMEAIKDTYKSGGSPE